MQYLERRFGMEPKIVDSRIKSLALALRQKSTDRAEFLQTFGRFCGIGSAHDVLGLPALGYILAALESAVVAKVSAQAYEQYCCVL